MFARLTTTVAFLVIAALAAAGPKLAEPRGRFTLTLPDGFVPAPELVGGKIAYAYKRPPADENGVGVTVVIEWMGGTIDREKFDPALAATRPDLRIEAARWKTFDLEVVRVPEAADGVTYLTFNTQVPLAAEAIQIKVFGREADEAELRAVNQAVLDRLDGPSNWLERKERIGRAMSGVFNLVLIVGGGAALIAFGVRQSRKRKQMLKPEERRTEPPSLPRRSDPDQR